MKLTGKDIGKRIGFTIHKTKKEWRVVLGVTPEGGAIVRYLGWSNFQIKPGEILEMI